MNDYTIDDIRTLDSQSILRIRLRKKDTLHIPDSNRNEVEGLLKESNIAYQTVQNSADITFFLIQN
jgi:hypothetical protein